MNRCQNDYFTPTRTPYQGPGVQSADNFVVPAISSTIDVTIVGTPLLPLDALLWASGIGYLKITTVSVNYQGNVTSVTLQNTGLAGTVGGTNVPALTIFTLTAPTP